MRPVGMLGLVALLLVATALVPARPASAADDKIVIDPGMQIKDLYIQQAEDAYHSEVRWNVDGGSTSADSWIISYDSHEAPAANEKFTLYVLPGGNVQIRNFAGYCLTEGYASNPDYWDWRVRLRPVTGGSCDAQNTAMQWRLRPYHGGYQFQNARDNQCVDVNELSGNAEIWPCGDASADPDQIWHLGGGGDSPEKLDRTLLALAATEALTACAGADPGQPTKCQVVNSKVTYEGNGDPVCVMDVHNVGTTNIPAGTNAFTMKTATGESTMTGDTWTDTLGMSSKVTVGIPDLGGSGEFGVSFSHAWGHEVQHQKTMSTEYDTQVTPPMIPPHNYGWVTVTPQVKKYSQGSFVFNMGSWDQWSYAPGGVDLTVPTPPKMGGYATVAGNGPDATQEGGSAKNECGGLTPKPPPQIVGQDKAKG